MALNRFRFQYGATLDIPNSKYQVIEVWHDEHATLQRTLRVSILVAGADQEELVDNVNELKTELSKFNAVLTVSMKKPDNTYKVLFSFDHAENSGFLFRVSMSKTNHPLNTSLTKVYIVTIRYHASAVFASSGDTNIGSNADYIKGFVDGSWLADSTPAGRRTVTIKANYTATPENATIGSDKRSAVEAYKNHFLSYAVDIIFNTLGLTDFEIIKPESWSVDDQDKQLKATIAFQEVLEAETAAETNDTALVDVEYAASISTPMIGLALKDHVVLKIGQNIVLSGQVHYSSKVNHTSIDPDTGAKWVIRKLFHTKVRAHIITRLGSLWTLGNKYTVAIGRLQESYNPHTSMFNVLWNVLLIPKGGSGGGESGGGPISGANPSGADRGTGGRGLTDKQTSLADLPSDEAFEDKDSANAVYISYQETIQEKLVTNLSLQKIADGKNYTRTGYTVGFGRRLVHTMSATTLKSRAPLLTPLSAPWQLISYEPGMGPDMLATVDNFSVGADASLSFDFERAYRRTVTATYEFAEIVRTQLPVPLTGGDSTGENKISNVVITPSGNRRR